MRHAIVGAGGVGGIMGGCLARIGEEVTLVVRPEKLAAHPAKLEIESTLGRWTAEVDWSATVPSADVIWLTVKATQLEPAVQLISNSAGAGPIVPLLNGLDHIELLRSRFGAERVIPATIAGEMERASDGRIVHPSPFLVLNISGRGRALLQSVTDKLRGIGVTCSFADDETTLLWTKLVFLGPFALATSAFGKAIGEVTTNPDRWSRLEACVRETCAAAAAEGAKVDAEAVLQIIRRAPPAMRSSMQKDVENGRAPELDAIGGAIVRAATRHGIKTPVTEELMAQIARHEEGARRAS